MKRKNNSDVTMERIETDLQREEFFKHLYSQSREQEIAQWGWGEEEREAFLAMQYKLQCNSYQWQYPHLEAMKLYCKGEPIGRMLITRSKEEVRLIDLTILPNYQRKRMGTSLILELQSEAREKNIPLCLSVHVNNSKAYALYQRLGFQKVSESEIYINMCWSANIEDHA